MSIKTPLKIGFIGTGNICQAIVKGLIQTESIKPNSIFLYNRSQHKSDKLAQDMGLNACGSLDELFDSSTLIFIAVKPNDFPDLLDQINRLINPSHHLISLAAGISLVSIARALNIDDRHVTRLISNVGISNGNGVTGLFSKNQFVTDQLTNLFKSASLVLRLEEEQHLEALLVATSSGIGFVLELITYFSDWLEDHGLTQNESRKLIEATFVGAGLLSRNSHDKNIEDLQNQIASKKGVTAQGLKAMREYEVERLIRISLDSAQKRNEELARSLS